MKINNNFLVSLIVIIGLVFIINACNKPVDDFPNSNEAISFVGIDSTTIKMKAGEDLVLDVVLITDTIIDSLRIGYLIDTVGITTNITYADIQTESIVHGFTEVNNKFVYPATIKLPANAFGIRAFRPFKNGVGDYVRIIFRMEAGTKSYEKQVKVIIEP